MLSIKGRHTSKYTNHPSQLDHKHWDASTLWLLKLTMCTCLEDAVCFGLLSATEHIETGLFLFYNDFYSVNWCKMAPQEKKKKCSVFSEGLPLAVMLHHHC